ncbi:zinc finger protein 2 homolog [Limulus polyphemus]|uniref:Zinc finger protein 2 homolog n=1 Tax=Limulus polyphemus TaxID=6850 RepID=A0ABM1BPL5_LIMPO|nr:zinc finger protein 2 homolog [Limulus polyphemus]XP_022254540.1 zinc finger protein 2 homolog [Limulus polyphemus]XP_022254541.1 zinc finger protein 2 homolog [Limulus polyphemus]XP_022254542.1 zinc finger protein 2 homolog [Limulus polyphemus]XP_022254543.1 zinc finger protein 2 homolog [Limulus polyphemus]XP_022254544.1 zinc finger protein 2 homolog [Limulus polyphemus]XP_022254546.1 zinc finger protein 2 homolog [Limulus polyphemus]XP_022254547.1 zinc finger protein 2 homolog [Limulus
MTTLVEEISSSETQSSNTSETICDGWDKNKDFCVKPTESLNVKCEICSKVFISSSFLMSHTEIYHKDKRKEVSKKENDKVFHALSNEENLMNTKSFSDEDISRDEDENHMICSNSYNDKDSANCEIPLEELIGDQSQNNIQKDENQEEEDKGTKDIGEQLVSGSEIYKCQFCEKSFTSEDSLMTHKKQHNFSSSEKYHCTQCNFSAKNNSELSTHLAIHQEDERPFKCLECGKGFKAQFNLRQHQKFHGDIQLEKCSLCDKMYRKGSGLATHMRAHLKSIPNSQSCENVKLHSHEIVVRKINNAGGKRFHCSVCDRGFSCTNNLMKHYIAKHDPNNPNIPSTSFETQKQEEETEETLCKDSYSCEKCGKLFTSMKMLEGHKKIHRNETEDRRFKCPHCKYSTNRSSDMRNHTVVHTNERPHQCNLCGKRFTERGRLRKHVLTHTGEKPFGCDVCGKKFSQRSHLNIHMRIHNKEKPYRCPYCEKTFAYHNVLTRHQRTHTGEKPYKCTHCSKSFKCSSALQDHEIAQHTHEYPFKCTECGKGFIQFGNMQVHLRNTHNIAIYKLKEVHN